MPEMDYMTQIIFDSHVLVLRVKKRDTASEKFHWTVRKSFEPPMDCKVESKSVLKIPPGTKATPPPDASSRNKANAAVFITMKGRSDMLTADSLKTLLQNYLKNEHKEALEDVKDTKRADLMIAYFNSWSTAKAVSTSYTDKMGEHEVAFELFAQTDPDQ